MTGLPNHFLTGSYLQVTSVQVPVSVVIHVSLRLSCDHCVVMSEPWWVESVEEGFSFLLVNVNSWFVSKPDKVNSDPSASQNCPPQSIVSSIVVENK